MIKGLSHHDLLEDGLDLLILLSLSLKFQNYRHVQHLAFQLHFKIDSEIWGWGWRHVFRLKSTTEDLVSQGSQGSCEPPWGINKTWRSLLCSSPYLFPSLSSSIFPAPACICHMAPLHLALPALAIVCQLFIVISSETTLPSFLRSP